MTHNNEGAIKVLQCLFEHIFCAQIKVVSRFVENEQIERLEQELENCQTRAFTTRKHLHLLRPFFTSKHESTEQITNLQTDFSLCHTVDGVVNSDFSIQQCGLILCKITYLHVMAKGECAFVFELSHDTFDQRGFTFTVSSNKSHFVTTLHHERCISEHHVVTISLTYSIHGHRITARTWRRWELQTQA